MSYRQLAMSQTKLPHCQMADQPRIRHDLCPGIETDPIYGEDHECGCWCHQLRSDEEVE